MNLVKKSGVARALLVLALFSVFSGYANPDSCTRRAARVVCSGAQVLGSAILFAGGILAATVKPAQQPPAEISPAVLTGTSIMLLGLGVSGINNGLKDMRTECCEDFADQDGEPVERNNEQKED